MADLHSHANDYYDLKAALGAESSGNPLAPMQRDPRRSVSIQPSANSKNYIYLDIFI